MTLPPRPFEETDPAGQVPPALRAVILKALAKKPEERFQSDAEFAEALRAALGPRDLRTVETPLPPVTTSPTTPATTMVDVEAPTVADGAPVTVVTSPGRKFRAVYGIAAVALLLAIAAAVLWRRAPDPVSRPAATASNTVAAAGTNVEVEAAPAPAPAPAPGQLLINAFPWGEVTSVTNAAGEEKLVGRADTPLVLSLPPGAYKVTLTNPNSDRSVVLNATVTSNTLARCEAELDRIDADAYVERLGIGR